MIQPLGILLILAGAVMWHIAASDTGATNVTDVWKEFLNVAVTTPDKTASVTPSDNTGEVSA